MKSTKCLILGFLAAATVPAFAGGEPAAGNAKSQVCVACHGPGGRSATGNFPTLAGQSEDYLVAALSQYKSGKRQNPIMAPQTANLSQQDMADLAAYFASQKGLKLKY